LLRAAVAVLADGGAKSVTHRAVAAKAGLPAASTTYYFESIQQLTDEALRLHLSERIAELQALIARATRSSRSAEQVAQRLAESLAARSRDIAVGQFEVYLEAARNSALREHVAETLAAFEQLTEAVLAGLGARRPAEGAEAFVALIDGFLLHWAARPRGVRRDAAALFEALRALFIAQIMDDEELGRWRERFREPLAP
jgi:DNA-binding transcriptional regulator YbjK